MAICTRGSSSKGWLYCGEGEPVRPQGAGSPPASPFPPPAARQAHLRYQPLHERLETAPALLELLQQPGIRQTLSIHGAGRSPPGLSAVKAHAQIKCAAPRADRAFQKYLRNRSRPSFRPPLPGSASGGDEGGRAARAGGTCAPLPHGALPRPLEASGRVARVSPLGAGGGPGP